MEFPAPLPASTPHKRRIWIWLIPLLLVLIALLCVAPTVFALSLRGNTENFRVEGQSMLPALKDGDYITVDRSAYISKEPQRGDIITFHFPVDPTQIFIKRVIGIPGDTVQIKLDRVIVNGHTLNENYITAPYNAQVNNWTLQPGQYFVMGDNRGNSYDSRFWGPVPQENIIGKATYIYWPFQDAGSMKDVSQTFNGV